MSARKPALFVVIGLLLGVGVGVKPGTPPVLDQRIENFRLMGSGHSKQA